jgi:hypothetical protein
MSAEEAPANFSRTLARLSAGQCKALLARLHAPCHPCPVGLWEIVSLLHTKPSIEVSPSQSSIKFLKGELVTV